MSKIPPDGDRAHNGYVSNGVHRPALAVASSKQAQEEVVRSKQVNANGAAAGPGILVTMDRSKCGEDGRPVVFRDPRTKLILRRLFSELCPACEKHLKQVERDLVRLADTDTESAKLVRRVSFLLVEFIRNTEQLSMNLKNFVEEEWNLHAGNMHMEFSKVAYETFREAANWGRVAMFLGFAVSFAVYLERGIVVGSADSVMEWTCQVVEENVGHFYTSHEGWVS